MQYFRHFTGGRKGDRLKKIYAEFGSNAGYGLYFKLLEMCAEKYNGRVETFEFLTKELVKELELRRKSLITLLQLLSNSSTITNLLETNNGEVIQFQWPQLIEIADDYTKKVRQTSDKNPKNVAPRNRTKRKDNTSLFIDQLEVVYKDYPNKEGKQSGLKKISKEIKTENDLLLFKKAVQNYAAKVRSEKTDKKYIKHFSTFCGGAWRDYVDIQVTQTNEEKLAETIARMVREGQEAAS